MESVLAQYGLAGLVITVLAGVVVYLYKDGKKLQQRYDEIQEKRLADAKETQDRLSGPLEQLAKQQEKMYDVLLNINDKRGA